MASYVHQFPGRSICFTKLTFQNVGLPLSGVIKIYPIVIPSIHVEDYAISRALVRLVGPDVHVVLMNVYNFPLIFDIVPPWWKNVSYYPTVQKRRP